MGQSSPHQLAVILAEAQARDGTDAAVIATDAYGNIVYWNDRAVALYGWRPDEAIGRNTDMLPTRSSSDEAAHIMERLRRGQTWTGNFIVQRRDGTPIVVHVTNVPIRDEGGEVIGIVGLSRREGRSTPAGGIPPQTR